MSVLSNAKLLACLQSWQDAIYAGRSVLKEIGFQDVMMELEERRLIDRYWRWIFDEEKIDKTFVRRTEREQ